jgi:hypothetical protein
MSHVFNSFCRNRAQDLAAIRGGHAALAPN